MEQQRRRGHQQDEQQWEQQQEGEEQQQEGDRQREQEQRAAALLRWASSGDAWLHSSRVEGAVKGPLLRLAAHYLLRERRRYVHMCRWMRARVWVGMWMWV